MASEDTIPTVSTNLNPSPLNPVEKHTYSQILRSSTIIGGSSVLNIACGVMRSKLMAVLLGPAGLGLMGLYISISDVTQSMAGLGVQNSGVREIADAIGSNDSKRLSLTAAVLRKTCTYLGLVGGLLLLILSPWLGTLTFGDKEHTVSIAFLSIAVCLRVMASGHGALLQGMRRIRDLAMMSIVGAFLGTLLTLPLVFFFREQGIVPSLIAVAATALWTASFFTRKIKARECPLTLRQLRRGAVPLMTLGFAFMISGFLTMGAAYAIRLVIVRGINVEAGGLYQSAWTIGGIYVAFILQAMGSDFYPRLTAVASNNRECNRLVNEQAQVGLLLAGPGVMITLTLAPYVIALLYSHKFSGAAPLLRWICLGMILRVISWPMGYILLAKGKSTMIVCTEVLATVIHVGLSCLLVPIFGLNGAGMAFLTLYIWHSVFIYLIVRKCSEFRWSIANKRMALMLLPLVALVFSAGLVLPARSSLLVGTILSAMSCAYSLSALHGLTLSQSGGVGLSRLFMRLRAT
jgi:antigen flippase